MINNVQLTNTINRGCCCLGTISLVTSNIAMLYNILAQYKGNIIRVKKISSQRFNSIFIDCNLFPNINVTACKHTNTGNNLKDARKKSIELINTNSGFEVTLWYSHGQINDQALVG